MRGLSGKVAFVTGASRGMGQAIARRLADEGGRVAVTDLDGATALEATRRHRSAVAFFASDDASYITGQTLSVRCGLTMS